MKNADYLEEYKIYLMEEEKSPATIASYTIDIQGFFDYIKKDIKKIKKTDLISYKDHLKKRIIISSDGEEKGLETSTINRKLVGVKQFIKFVNEKYDLSIADRVKQEKVQRQYSLKDEKVLTQSDFEKLIKVIEDAGDLRTKALFEAMALTGMRISECLKLRVGHIQGKTGVIDIKMKGKGDKERDIYINEELLHSLNEYLKVRKIPYSSTKNTKELFLGERGPLTRQAAHQLMKKYAKKAGIEPTKAHVHNLRHLYGLNLAADGWTIEEIADALGHEDINTTRIYVTKPQSHIKNRINKLSAKRNQPIGAI